MNKQAFIYPLVYRYIMNQLANMANPDCEECGGEGHCSYAKGEDSEELPCDKCFPNMTWEDFIDPDQDNGVDD